jgi:hypothetical protein
VGAPSELGTLIVKLASSKALAAPPDHAIAWLRTNG